MTVESFRPEINEALRNYERYIVCLDKPPVDCEQSLVSLLTKAIEAYTGRGPNLRHGIALDHHLTVILSQSDTDRPLCAIYFNLHTPYQRRAAGRTAGARRESGKS